MKKSFLAVFIVFVLLVVLIPTAFACSSQEDLVITEDGFEYSYVKLFQSCIIYWPANDGVEVYELKVYPTGDLTKCLLSADVKQSPTTIKNSYTLSDDVCSWQYLDIYITGFTSDKSVASNTIKKTIVCSVEDEDVYMAEEQAAGVIPGYEESVEYYYVKLANNISIVKPQETKKYAIVVDDISSVDSVRLPINYDGAYTLNSQLNAIVIDDKIVNAYSFGSIFPMFVTYKNNEVKKYDIAIVNALTPYISPVIINRGSNTSLTITCLSDNSEWDIEQVLLDNKICELCKDDGYSVMFSVENLKKIPNGDHNLKIYYEYNDTMIGYSETTLTINAGGRAPYNVTLSYDDTYPAVKVSWDADHEYKCAHLFVNSTELSTDNQPELFIDNSITLTNYITRKEDKVRVKLIYDDGEEYTSDAVSLDYNLTDFTGKESYFNTKVQYLDKTINKYIASEEELNDFVAYHVIHYGDSDTFRVSQCNVQETYSICSPYLIGKYKTRANIEELIKKAMKIFIEPLNYDVISCTVSGDIITYKIALYSGSTRPYNSYHAYAGTDSYQEYQYSELHYYTNGESQRSSTFDDFKYKQNKTTVTVSTSLELALALEKGLNVNVVAGSNAELILNKAKEVLREIIDDRMTDYEKVLALFDWMTYNVIYDRGLTAEMATYDITSSEYRAIYKNSSFYAEGVFLYKVAVCNGIGSAFSIMANIEGIPAYKTMGTVSTVSTGGKKTLGSHTWVKVFVNNEWFICDPTWSNLPDVENSKSYEYISYDFFMISEAEGYAYRERTQFDDKDAATVYAGNATFNYFNSSYFTYQGKVYTKYITSTKEFEALMGYYTELLQTGDEIQISIRAPKIYSTYSSSAEIIYKWLTEVYYPQHTDVQDNYGVRIYTRADGDLKQIGSTDDGIINETFNDIVYIRIRAL